MYFGNMVYILEAPSTPFATRTNSKKSTTTTPTSRTTASPTSRTIRIKVTRKVPVNNMVII
jgi:hypothetical protein